jgi:hypothetical protein
LKGWRILLVFNGQVIGQHRSGYAMSKRIGLLNSKRQYRKKTRSQSF